MIKTFLVLAIFFKNLTI